MGFRKFQMPLTIIIIMAIILYSIYFLFFNNGQNIENVSEHSEVVDVLDQKETEETQGITAPLTNTWLYISIIVLSITTMGAVAISYYLYRWRSILLSNKEMVVPEKWAASLDSIGNTVGKFTVVIESEFIKLIRSSDENTSKLASMIDTYLELQTVLNQKDEEIKRLRSGYDAEIFRKFISRFIRVDQAIEDIRTTNEDVSSLTQIQEILSDALEECGVSKFIPKVGENYKTAFGVADNPKCQETDDFEKDFQISEVVEEGYKFVGAEVENVITPAKVRIFRYLDRT